MHKLGVLAWSEDPKKNLADHFVRFLGTWRVRAPEGRQKGHLGALSIDFSAMVADRHHASKMRPHIIRRPDRRWRTRERLLHLFGDRPRSHTSPSAALGIRTILSGAVVVELAVHRPFGGRIFDA